MSVSPGSAQAADPTPTDHRFFARSARVAPHIVDMDRRGWLVPATATLVMIGGCCVVACVGGFLLFGGRYTPCVPGRPAGISAEELAGRYITDGQGELVLDRAGTFTLRGITIEFDNEPLTLSGPGTWSLLAHDEGFGDINLGFSDAKFSTYLQISGTRTRPWLYWFIGDPDLCHIRRFNRV